MTNKVKVKTPNGLFIVYNYRERFGNKYINKDEFEPDQVILNSASLLSMATNKSKGAPAGTFEIRLAASKNWVSAITPGSWCVILMSNSQIGVGAKYNHTDTVNEKSFKMLGRIDSVRSVSSVNPQDGSTLKYYVVTGTDWGTIFNSMLYVDPLGRNPEETAVGMALSFLYTDFIQRSNVEGSVGKSSKSTPISKDKQTSGALADMTKTSSEVKEAAKNKSAIDNTPAKSEVADKAAKNKNYFNVSDTIDFLIKLWGVNQNNAKALFGDKINQVTQGKLLGRAQNEFRLPDKLKKYMNLKENTGTGFIDTKSGCGILVDYDKYSGKDDSFVFLTHDSVYGEHTMWDVITRNMNRLTSELIAEVRFENESTPSLALYNRCKPFVVDKSRLYNDSYYVGDGKSSDSVSSLVDQYVSEFKNIRCIEIDYNDVLFSSCGTNWRDKINFVEVSIDASYAFSGTDTQAMANYLALGSNFYDPRSIARDGLRSRRETTYVLPNAVIARDADISKMHGLKYLMKEWYFHTHTMLNGSLHLVGQDRYIQVGDNIKIDSRVLDINNNFNDIQKNKKETIFFIAHVESISHNISYEEDHRSFTTNIVFSRGIFVDENLNRIQTDSGGALDQDASLLTPTEEKNYRASTSSSFADPDAQKLGGNK
jgi:hypothetical protein